jgi:hypothetical protein
MRTRDKPTPLLLSCGILREEIEALIARGELEAEVFFLSRDLHSDPSRLGRALEQELQKCEENGGPLPVVVYGDVCLGFGKEMKALVKQYGALKVDALNCIDCLLGGKGKLLEIDPDHKFLLLTPAFIEFTQRIFSRRREETRRLFSRLEGIILIDSLGNLGDFQKQIEQISNRTGLAVVETLAVGLSGLQQVLTEAFGKCPT